MTDQIKPDDDAYAKDCQDAIASYNFFIPLFSLLFIAAACYSWLGQHRPQTALMVLVVGALAVGYNFMWRNLYQSRLDHYRLWHNV